MASVHTLTRLPGVTSLRLQPSGVTAALGDYVFCFGSDVAGEVQFVTNGQGVTLHQTADITGLKLVRFRAVVRPPTELPATARDDTTGLVSAVDLQWLFTWGIGPLIHGQRYIVPGRTRTISDGIIDVSQLLGNQNLRFTLRAAL